MSDEEIKDLFDAIDNRLILYQAINQIPNIDFDRLVRLSVAYEELQKENQQLKEQLKQRDEVFDEAIKQTEFIDKLLERLCEPKINNKGETHFDFIREDILQIIDKYLGDEDVSTNKE